MPAMGGDMTVIDIPLAPTGLTERADWARRHTLTRYVPHKVEREDRADGTILLRSGHALPPVAPNTGAWLHDWAEKAPYRIAVSERPVSGAGFRNVTYAELLDQVRAVASALLARGLGGDDTIAILSGNGVDHLILSLAAQYVGIPVVPLAEQYALIPEAHGRLTYVLNKVHPKLAFVDDATRYAAALALPELDGIELVAVRGEAGRPVTPFADLLAGADGVDVDAAHAKVGRPALPGRPRAADHRLAAVEPRLRRQPQRQHDAGEWRHPDHRQRQAHRAGLRDHAEEPHRPARDTGVQRAGGLRDDCRRAGRQARAAPAHLQGPATAVLRRGLAAPAGLGGAGALLLRGARRPAADDLELGPHRDRAGLPDGA
jgi:hypothetical protein